MAQAKQPKETAEQRRIREAISKDLWDAFRALVEETKAGASYDNTSSDHWPHTMSEAVSMLFEHIGMKSDSDATFVRTFLEIFPPPPPKTYKFELALSDKDRQKILDDLGNQCLSAETKEQIKKALSGDGDA